MRNIFKKHSKTYETYKKKKIAFSLFLVVVILTKEKKILIYLFNRLDMRESQSKYLEKQKSFVLFVVWKFKL